jgi:aryl-alcohol dehydrogenase-like predicted oxidoreductase
MSAPGGGMKLGLGLVSIGRPWGEHGGQPLADEAAQELIVGAVGLGITVFDTAPAYGASETLLGQALERLSPQRDRLTVATKMGEHWVDATSPTAVDHSYDALTRSLDRSMQILGRIDVLQIHKATAANLMSADVRRALSYARSLGIQRFGASISDLATADVAIASGDFEMLQFPYNAQSTGFAPLFVRLEAAGMTPMINRPLAMGAAIMGAVAEVAAGDKPAAIRAALQLIHTQCQQSGCQHGVILTGTRHLAHLAETLEAHRRVTSG